jgi:hypothetical protein
MKRKQDAGGTDVMPPPKRKRVRVRTGQLAAVPLLDGTFALVHVALYTGNVVAAHFAHRKEAPEKLLDGLDEALQAGPIAVFEVTSDEIYDGHWAVIGHRDPAYPAALLDMLGRSYGAASTRAFYEAYYGLRAWDELYDPKDYERQLLPGVPVPQTVRYKRDFEKAAMAATTTTTPAGAAHDAGEAPAITEGPAVIHIEIKYPGEELPTIPLLKRREAIENALEAAGVGEVTDAGGGGGVMDIYLETKDVARAMPFVHAAVKEAGFENDARIEVDPVSEDEDDSGCADEDDN